MLDNVCELSYLDILRGRIERGEIDYGRALKWLTGAGMDHGDARELLLADADGP
jgi:hypothetical protein